MVKRFFISWLFGMTTVSHSRVSMAVERQRILSDQVDMVVNTPFGSPGNSGPRLDGYEIRTAAVAAGTGVAAPADYAAEMAEDALRDPPEGIRGAAGW